MIMGLKYDVFEVDFMKTVTHLTELIFGHRKGLLPDLMFWRPDPTEGIKESTAHGVWPKTPKGKLFQSLYVKIFYLFHLVSN